MWKRWICFALCAVLLLSAACGKKPDRKESEAAPTQAAARETPAPTPEPTPEPAPTPEPVAAREAFLALDREMFVWYVTQDITYLDQFVVDPAAYGIDEASVPVTMGEFTLEADEKWMDECEAFLSRLQQIDGDALDERNRFAYDVIWQFLELELLLRGKTCYYEPLEQYTGLQVNLPLTFELYVFRDAQDVENYLTLMADVPRYMQQVIEFEQKRAELGLFMTEVALDSVLLDCQAMIDAKEDCALYDTFLDELNELADLDEAKKADYIKRNNELVANSFLPSYQQLYDALEALRPSCRETLGMSALGEEAKAYYAARMQARAACDLEPQEALELLVKYVNSCQESMRTQYFADPSVNERYADDDIVTYDSIEENVAYLSKLIAEYMPELPEVDVTYKEIPEELQDSFSPAAYLIPPVDEWVENTILINPVNDADLMTLAHEAYPGHMFQFVYQRAADNESLFQRIVSPIGYAEGWSTSAELSISLRAEAFDTAYCLFRHYWDYMCYCLYAACSIQVNYFGYGTAELAGFLSAWGFEASAASIYQLSVDMPTYYFCYALGYCQQQEVYANTYAAYAFSDKEFYTAYLDLGAGYFHLVGPAMLAWAQQMSGTDADSSGGTGV